MTVAWALVLAVVLSVSANAQVGQSQTVVSSGGGYAHGTGSGKLSEGRYLRFYAFFAHPEGTLTASAATDGLDLAAPVGTLELEARTPPPRTESFGTSEILCRTARNTGSYSTGRLVPATNADGTKGIAWTGAWFDVKCDSSLGFDFFRVHFDHTVWNGEPRPAQRFEPGEAGVRTTKGKGFVGPETETPYLYLGGGPIVNEHETSWQWSAPGRLGTLIAEPLMRQSLEVTLCGHRSGGEVQCWGGETSTGIAFPFTTGMTHSVNPW